MKTILLAMAVASVALVGCTSTRSNASLTNPHQPGPAVGQAVGTAVGAVAGNVAGAVVGAGEGAAKGAAASFNGEKRVIRTWKTETTADGRTIQVPVDVEVDENGKVIGEVKNQASN